MYPKYQQPAFVHIPMVEVSKNINASSIKLWAVDVVDIVKTEGAHWDGALPLFGYDDISDQNKLMLPQLDLTGKTVYSFRPIKGVHPDPKVGTGIALFAAFESQYNIPKSGELMMVHADERNHVKGMVHVKWVDKCVYVSMSAVEAFPALAITFRIRGEMRVSFANSGLPYDQMADDYDSFMVNEATALEYMFGLDQEMFSVNDEGTDSITVDQYLNHYINLQLGRPSNAEAYGEHNLTTPEVTPTVEQEEMPTDTFKAAIRLPSDDVAPKPRKGGRWKKSTAKEPSAYVLTTHDGGSVAYQKDALYVLPEVVIPQPTISLTRIDCWLERLLDSALDGEYGYSSAKAAEELSTIAPPSFGKLTGKLNLVNCYRTVMDTDDGHDVIYLFQRKNKRATSVPNLQAYVVQTVSAPGSDHPTVTYICNHDDSVTATPKMTIAHASLGAAGSLKSALSIVPSIDDGNHTPPTYDLLPPQIMHAPGTETLSDEDKLLCLYFQPLSEMVYQLPVKKGVKLKTDNVVSFPYTEYAKLVHALTTSNNAASRELPSPPSEVVVPSELLGDKLVNSNGGTTGDIDAENFTQVSTASFIEENGGLLLSEMNDEQVEMLKSGWPAMYKHAIAGGRVILPRQNLTDESIDLLTHEERKIAEMFGIDPVSWAKVLKHAQQQGVLSLPTRNIAVTPPSPEDFEGDAINQAEVTLRDPVVKPKEEKVVPNVPTGDDLPIPPGYVKEDDVITAMNVIRRDLTNYLQDDITITPTARNRIEGAIATLTAIVVVGTTDVLDPTNFADSIITAAIVADGVRNVRVRSTGRDDDRDEGRDGHDERHSGYRRDSQRERPHRYERSDTRRPSRF